VFFKENKKIFQDDKPEPDLKQFLLLSGDGKKEIKIVK